MPAAEQRPEHPADLGVLGVTAHLRSGEISAVELLDFCLGRIEERNGGSPTMDGSPDAVNAWVRTYPELAHEAARAADERLRREGQEAPLLCGVPIGLKDLYAVAGLPLTASSRVLEGNVAERDCEVWARLRNRGMVLVGHTHTHEFAAGGTTDQVGNPWALECSAGGSSGGSAAALAAGMIPAAVGTDTLGSLRIPAAHCGTSAIKPTHGRVPFDGIVRLSASLDHAGPMARTVADCSVLLAGMAADGAETTPLMPPPAPLRNLPLTPRPGPLPLAGLTVALTDRPERQPLDPDVGDGLERARSACERLGAKTVMYAAPPELPPSDMSAILLTDMWSVHRDLAHRADRYRPSIQELVEAASGVSDANAYIEAGKRRSDFTARWESWFADHDVDLLLEPTSPIVAQGRGEGYERGHAGGEGDPLIALTSTWNLTGFPVAALPAGLGDRSGLPVGVSLAAVRGAEALAIQAAIDLQEHSLPAQTAAT
jgi:aspartyl-tRNA(Asn)/glutamyl-tRNA(Gln) amidotransferase subunit A